LEVISRSFAGQEDRWPPVLTLEQAAALLSLKPQTLRKHLSEGRYRRSSRPRRPVRFLRDILVLEYMEGGR
jgi:hypothetical protein